MLGVRPVTIWLLKIHSLAHHLNASNTTNERRSSSGITTLCPVFLPRSHTPNRTEIKGFKVLCNQPLYYMGICCTIQTRIGISSFRERYTQPLYYSTMWRWWIPRPQRPALQTGALPLSYISI